MSFAPRFCANKECGFHVQPNGRFTRKGFFYVKNCGRNFRRFQCTCCKKTFSSRTFTNIYRQHRPELNEQVYRLYNEGSSERAMARVLRCNRKTVARKIKWLWKHMEKISHFCPSKRIYFDEMESIEHTKCKPLSILVLTNEKYEILSARVAQIPAKGHLARFSQARYGFREDQSGEVLRSTFERLKAALPEVGHFLSDAKPSYRKIVEEFYPGARHDVHSRAQKERHRERLHEKARKKEYDPLFPLNQRCAKIRSDLKRMTRRSWCTTKLPQNLERQLNIYAFYNNFKGAYPL